MKTQTDVWLYMCGNGNAWPRQLGCRCGRCTTINYNLLPLPTQLQEFFGWDDPPIRAHTSAAIILADARKQIGNYFLVDCGAGVVQSLICSGLEGLENLTSLFLTHWHPDHNAGLNELCETIKKSKAGRGAAFVKFPVYATLETYKKVREDKGFKYEFDTFMRFQEVIPDIPFVVQEEPKVTVTAVEVSHGGIRGAVVYIFKIGEKKVVCFWDIDMPEALRPSDLLSNIAALQARKSLFEDAGCMILETNTYSASTSHGKPTGHTTYEGALAYLDMLAPKARKDGKVFITHMSGHEDGAGNPGYGWSDSEWEKAILKKDNLHIARQAMIVQV